MDLADPLILTLSLDERSLAFFDEQRRRYFPPDRNFIPAHLTLFHKLPGAHLASILQTTEAYASAQQPLSLQVHGVRSLGRGVAYTLASPKLMQLRAKLAREWASWLEAQDRQSHQPHVTVQNKVSPEQARTLHANLAAAFQPFTVTGVGLELWWYRGGPWERVGRFPFAQGAGPGEPL